MIMIMVDGGNSQQRLRLRQAPGERHFYETAQWLACRLDIICRSLEVVIFRHPTP